MSLLLLAIVPSVESRSVFVAGQMAARRGHCSHAVVRVVGSDIKPEIGRASYIARQNLFESALQRSTPFLKSRYRLLGS